MNIDNKEIIALGVPQACLRTAQDSVNSAAIDARRRGSKRNFRKLVARVVQTPEDWLDDPFFGSLASELIQYQDRMNRAPIEVKAWGREHIEPEAIQALENFARNPRAVAAAMMPDAHGNLGMPVGGVIALENAVCPGAVGLDIACRMKLSILDLPVPQTNVWENEIFDQALFAGSCFGFNEKHSKRQQHQVMDADWSVTKITKRRKAKAWSQLGTSGGGNHFVEYGLLNVPFDLELIPAGQYVALLSHSGSRGTGAEVAKWYTKLAIEQSHKRGETDADESTAYLDMDSEAGQEYWAAMNLMGDYAKANHDVIHRNMAEVTGAQVLAEIENHHNFAWKETHFGEDVYVHRKGATPAQAGRLGIIPGSMGSPAHVVIGKGNADSLHSASHGAGRRLNRGQAKSQLNMEQVQRELAASGVRLLQGSIDESPAVYKDIEQVMNSQTDLVDSIATFEPKVVRMAGKRNA